MEFIQHPRPFVFKRQRRLLVVGDDDTVLGQELEHFDDWYGKNDDG